MPTQRRSKHGPSGWFRCFSLPCLHVAASLVVSFAMGCAPSKKSTSHAGVWTTGDPPVRTYDLRDDGTFELLLHPERCASPKDGAEASTSTGRWMIEEGGLRLDLVESDDPVLKGATMIEAIVSTTPSSMTLKSSVLLCGTDLGEEVALRRAGASRDPGTR